MFENQVKCVCGKVYNTGGLRPGIEVKCRKCGEMVVVPEHKFQKILIGKFELLEELSDSGTSKVFRAFDTELQREVAVKVLKGRMDKSVRLRNRFKQEVHTAGKIDDKHIVKVLEAGFEGDTGYIVMDYVKGKSVRAMLDKYGKLPLKLAMQLVIQVARGLTVAHRFGVIHRDIKPENLLIGVDGTVKILDFGFARDSEEEEERLTLAGQVIGSYNYMAPEQVDSRNAGSQVDIYSLGITFYELVTGELPFDDKSAVRIVLKHQSEPLPDIRAKVPSFPDGAVAVLEKMTAKKPGDRYQKASEIVEQLKPIAKSL